MVLTMLQVQLLGGFRLLADDEPVDGINTARLQSLVAYLALHRDTPQLRQHLAFLYWPDSSEAQARNNLRQLLHALRLAVPAVDAFLSTDTNTIRWRPGAAVHLDVDEFNHALARAEAAEHRNDRNATLVALEQAASVYQADLLPSCYDEWIQPEREQLRRRYLQALDRLIQLLEEQHKYAAAIAFAQRIIHNDALNEDAYRSLMRLLARTGDRSGAVRVYQDCVRVLQSVLGIEPSQATRETYQRLLLDSAHASESDTDSTEMPSLIGRQREWDVLLDAWYQACSAGPGFVLVTGEAGIGKSYLTEELRLWVGRQAATTAKSRSYAAEGSLSLAPVADWLRGDGLRQHLAGLDPVWLAEVARILPELLSEYPDLPKCEPMSEYGQRQRFFQALGRAVFAAPQPILLVIDDLQWCDQETLEWLHFLLRFEPSARLLIVGNARIEEIPPQHPLRTLLLHLRATIGVTEIALQPLDAAETAELAARLIRRDLEVSAAMRLYHETEGNPLFVVETVRAGFEQISESEEGTNSRIHHPQTDATHALPPRVQAVISGRLEQLTSPARELVAISAAIGREFGLDVLARSGGVDEASALRSLDELGQRRIIREQGANRYDFTHDKLREVAYVKIGTTQRQVLHRRIAQALEGIYADDLDTVSGQIAAHYERAGCSAQAIPYYEQAAAVAQRIYANEDAISFLSWAMALLEHLPGGLRRDLQELRLLLALAPIYRIIRGWTAPELESLVDRALALCDTVGDEAQRASALYGQQSLLTVQARLEKVQLVADELQALYQRAHIAPPPLSRMMLAGSRMHLGRLAEANEAFTEIMATPSAPHVHSLQESQGWNFEVHSLAWQSHVLWCLGYPDRAIRVGRDAIQLAHNLAQPFNQALASTYFAMLQQMCADPAAARREAEAALALTIEYNSPYYRAWSAIMMTYAQAREHPDSASLEQLRACIAEFRATGARLRLPYYLCLLAQGYGWVGDFAQGLAIIDEAMAESRANSERWWDAELHRLRGELLLASGVNVHDVEVVLARAIKIARLQQAKSLELRATVSLARLWRDRGGEDDALQSLSEVYSWFSEGFEMPDLQDAQSVLARSK